MRAAISVKMHLLWSRSTGLAITITIAIAMLAATVGSVPAAATSPTAAALLQQRPQQQQQQQELPSASTGADDAAGFALDAGNIDFDGGEFDAAIPSEIDFEVTPCSVSAPERNECIRDLIQTIAPKLRENGLPQYNMGAIDPYFYKRGIFRYANDGIQGGLLIKNMNIHGISDLRVNNVLSNFTERGFIIKLGAELPQLRADGHFKADVKFGGLRLAPRGPFNITIDNIRATVLTDGVIENTEVGQRLSLRRLNANVAIGDARIVANSIFSDRNLNSMILNLVNENLPEITRVGIPATRDQWAPILVTHINQFFAQVPIEKFLVQ